MFQSFIFDTSSNETYGIMGISFNSVDETISAGLQTELKQEKSALGNKFYIIEQPYAEPIKFTLQIMNQDKTPITSIKERAIKQWLCHPGEYRWFYVNEEDRRDYWYHVNISNPQLIDFGGIVGMEFTVTCDSPFAYSAPITKQYIYAANSSNVVLIQNDTDDYVYPTVTIEMTGSGNLNISNSTEVVHRVTTVDSVINGEVITINSEIPTINTSITSHKSSIYSNWNKNGIRLINGANILTSNLACTITLNYREIRGVGVR